MLQENLARPSLVSLLNTLVRTFRNWLVVRPSGILLSSMWFFRIFLALISESLGNVDPSVFLDSSNSSCEQPFHIHELGQRDHGLCRP